VRANFRLQQSPLQKSTLQTGETPPQTFETNLSLRHPIRDLSLADFNWVAQKSIYANPVLVTGYHADAKEQAGARCATRNIDSNTRESNTRAAIETHHRGGSELFRDFVTDMVISRNE
jgi:hypothetical protein